MCNHRLSGFYNGDLRVYVDVSCDDVPDGEYPAVITVDVSHDAPSVTCPFCKEEIPLEANNTVLG